MPLMVDAKIARIPRRMRRGDEVNGKRRKKRKRKKKRRRKRKTRRRTYPLLLL